MRLLINAFNAGELSPELTGRVDLESLRKACRRLRNFIPRTLGGARRRPGLMHAGLAKLPDRACRLLPFNFSTDSRFVLELGEGYVRFWKNGEAVRTPDPAPAGVVSAPGQPLEVAVPWTAGQLFSVQMVQVNDLIFFTHPEVPVHELRRVADDRWTLGALAWRWPAMRDENDAGTTMQYTSAQGTMAGHTGTLTAGAATFEPGNLGGYYQLTHARTAASAELPLTANGQTNGTNGPGLRVLGKWEVFSFGTWSGTLYLEQAEGEGESAVWTVLRSWTSTADRNVQSNGEVDRETRLRLRFVHTGSSGSTPPRATLEAIDSEVHGLLEITEVTSATVAQVKVVRDIHATGTPTLRWAEGAWSARRGYPRAVALHEQRLIFGGNRAEPQKVWGSAVSDFNNFQSTTLEDAAFSVQVAAQEANPIVWLASQDGLIVGTEGDEWLMDSGNGIISAGNPPNSRRKTKFGSADVQAQLTGSVVLFIQRGGRKMREYVFAFDEQGYKAPDLTQLSDHLTRSGFRQFGYAQNPDSTLWAATNDGRLLSCTYQRESEVVAWAEHVTAGAVESVCVIYGQGDADEVWLSVRRTVNGTTARHIERFDPEHWSLLEDEVQEQLVYLDAAKRFGFSGPTANVTGLAHLEGATVSLMVDGAAQSPRKVIGGAVTLEQPGTRVIAGLPYTSELQPFPFDIPLGDGTAQGRPMRTPEIRLRLWKSGAAEYADDPSAPFYTVPFRRAGDALDAPPPLYTGDTPPLPLQSAYQTGLEVTIRTDSALPLNLLSVVTRSGFFGE